MIHRVRMIADLLIPAEIDMKSYAFPIMNPFTREWYVDNCDGTFSTLTNEEYEQWSKENGFIFLTRYDKPTSD